MEYVHDIPIVPLQCTCSHEVGTTGKSCVASGCGERVSLDGLVQEMDCKAIT